MKQEKPNLPVSVAARLLNRARQTGDDYQTLLTSFCLERFLYRLGVSNARARFVLKGAMLLRLWSDQPAYLASRFEFDRATLGEALRRTFARRHTPVPEEEPIGLTDAYWENASRAPQVRAFARRAGLTVGPGPGGDILSALRPFLLPILDDLRRAVAPPGTWAPGGPWRSTDGGGDYSRETV